MVDLNQRNNGPSIDDNNRAIARNLYFVSPCIQNKRHQYKILPKNEKKKFEDSPTEIFADYMNILLKKVTKFLSSKFFHNFFQLAITILYTIFLLNQYVYCFVDFTMPTLSLINLINAILTSLIITKSLESLFCRLSPKSSISSNKLQRPKETTYKKVSSNNYPRATIPPKKGLLAIFLLFFCIFENAEAIRITSLSVPPHQVSGESVELECHYDQESDLLYSVKWYRGSREFFRVVPGDPSPMQVFDIPGVVVDTSLSDKNKVTLRSVTRESSGKYKCEVSADAPSFHTASKTSEMLVVDLPSSVPNITGGRTKYHVGDEVHVNCTSAKSRPAASLMWYINGNPAKIENLVEYAPFQDEDGLETARLGLRFYVGAKDFPEGVLRIRCTATIAAVYWQSSEEAVEGQLPQTSPALESKGVYTGGSSLVDISSLVIISTNLLQGTLLGCFLFR